jgi:hypothetical protein
VRISVKFLDGGPPQISRAMLLSLSKFMFDQVIDSFAGQDMVLPMRRYNTVVIMLQYCHIRDRTTDKYSQVPTGQRI